MTLTAELKRVKFSTKHNQRITMIFYQLFESESSTYSYLLACEKTKEAVLIDPVLETLGRDQNLINTLELKLKYTIETHVHADHITSASSLKEIYHCKNLVSINSKVNCADIYLKENDVINFGEENLIVLETPGHTHSCICLKNDSMIFTGDLLFIRGTGRTDFQEGNAHKMYQNIHEKIFTLPDQTRIYPGHDYKGIPYTTVELEKKFNPRINLKISENDFVEIMSKLNLSFPKKIKESVPANLNCGKLETH